MNIILKNSLRNIFGKPFRTLLIVISIFACAFCGYLCFDIGKTIEDLSMSLVTSITTADLSVTSGGMDISNISEVLPEADILAISANSDLIYTDIEDEYNYASTTRLSIYGMDTEAAETLGFLKDIQAKDGEIVLSNVFAAKFGYKAGDTIVVHDRDKNEVELKVASILPRNGQNPILEGYKGVVNEKTGAILSCGDQDTSVVLIDIKDDSQIEAAKKSIEEHYPDAYVDDMSLSDEDHAMIGEMKAFLYLIFAILFLLVIFVTASVSNRIVSERMSFIGTLRSLGMSTRKTGLILILENVLYALLGSVPATFLYLPIRDSLLKSMFTVESDAGAVSFDLPELSIAIPVCVVIGAILIECLIPLRAILRALKTSIRDIIFDNRDTEYRFSTVLTIAGVAFLGIAVITFFLRTNLIWATVCLLSGVTSLALLFPIVLKCISKGIGMISEKAGNASWSLAAVETIARKSTVGSGVLLATAAAMCLIIFSMAGSMEEAMGEVTYRCDAILTCSKTGKYYTYVDHLEGITETERIYSSLETICVGDDPASFSAVMKGYPDGGYRLQKNYEEMPEKIEPGTVLIDGRFAEKEGYKAGDKIKITLHPDGILPITKEYEISKIIYSARLEGGKACIFLPEEEYKLLLNDNPSAILINCDDPEKLVSTVKIYAGDTVSDAVTYQEAVESAKEETAQLTMIMSFVIIGALAMTCIGSISNQLIGFAGRKKECAVMLSTAMSKKKLSGILFKEVLITSIAAAGIGTLSGHILTGIIGDAIDHAASIGLYIEADAGRTVTFFLVLVVIFALTVLLPIRSLRKMKISEQIKYE